MEKKVKKLYIDMDGVLADFQKGVEALCGIGTEDDDAMWAAIKEVEHFYYKLEPVKGAIEMIQALIEKYGEKCEILSAVPKEKRGIVHAEEDKRKWVCKYIGDDIIVNIVHDWKEKLPYCTGDDCILIDDRLENIEGWENAGGTGILFRNAREAYKNVSELEEYREVNSMFGELEQCAEEVIQLIGYPEGYTDDDFTEDNVTIVRMDDGVEIEICFWHEAELCMCDVSVDKEIFDAICGLTFEQYMKMNGMYVENICVNNLKWKYCGGIEKDEVYRLQYVVAN